MQVLHSGQRDFEPLLLQNSGQVTTWCWWRKTFPDSLLQNNPKWLHSDLVALQAMRHVQLNFHVHQTTLSPVLLCVFVHYHPDKRHHLQGTMFETLGAHGPTWVRFQKASFTNYGRKFRRCQHSLTRGGSTRVARGPPYLPPQNYPRIKYKCKQCSMCYFSAAAMTA